MANLLSDARTLRNGTLACWVALQILLPISGCGRTADDPAAANDLKVADSETSVSTSAVGGNEKLASTVNQIGMAGTQACAGCHQDIYDAFIQTPHSKSLRKADASMAATGVTMNHPISKRSYDVIQEGQQLRHREWEHLVPDGAALKPTDMRFQVANLRVDYIMGSGSFAQAYLLRDGDFLLQSPVTWYKSENDYAIAPGYDAEIHRGCNRLIEQRCLFCHVSQVAQDKPQFPKILEAAIGCERCHGPSAGHVAHQESKSQDSAGTPPESARTIHPAELSRSAADSICAQCHLGGDVVVDASGKQVWDFVPGEDFSDTRLVYRVDDGDDDDPFSMHFEQMWKSDCYLESETLSCTTCHDPHHNAPTGDVAAFYRNKCFECHNNEACGISMDQRKQEQQNQCVKCHMPTRDSATVHSATTHHRIGIHRTATDTQKPTSPQPVVPRPVVLKRIHPKNQADPNRDLVVADLLAKAYWLLEYEGDPGKTRGLDAAEIEAALLKSTQASKGTPPKRTSKHWMMLARLTAFQAQRARDQAERIELGSRSEEYAIKALANPEIEFDSRLSALEVLANQRYEKSDFKGAVESYQELTKIRRSAIDHYNLGLSFGKLQDYGKAEQALKQALQLDPAYPLPYRSLSKLYAMRGNLPLSQQMEQAANAIILNHRRAIGQ